MNIKPLLFEKILRYGLIGAISTSIHVAVAFLWIYFVNDSLFFSNMSGFLSAFTFSYTVQSRFVFQVPLSYQKAFRYFTVQIAALILSIVASDTVSGYNTYIQTIIVALILPIFTYFIHSIWTFSSDANKDIP